MQQNLKIQTNHSQQNITHHHHQNTNLSQSNTNTNTNHNSSHSHGTLHFSSSASINYRNYYFQSQSHSPNQPNKSNSQRTYSNFLTHSKPSPLSIIALALSHKTKSNQSIAIASRSELKILNLFHPSHQSSSIKSKTNFSSSFSSQSTHSASSVSSSTSLKPNSISIQEKFHINLNSQLGPHYGISNLNFGYLNSNDHLASATTNGAILIWDLNSILSNQLNPLIKIDHAHSRAINKINFASPIGHWIVTGSQDGLIKLWDIREGNSSPQVVITTHSDPVRQLRFHPDRSSDPFSFMALTDSGTLLHYDLRNGSQKSCMNRRVAHGSVGLGLDWKVTETQNLIASSGTDGIVKIWRMGQDKVIGSTAMKTLVVGRSIKDVVWRPGYEYQLVISPSDSVMSDPMMIRSSGSSLALNSSNSLVMNYSSSGSIDQKPLEAIDGGRHSEILVWDIRRERRPEFVLKGQDGSASGVIWLNSDLLITTHKRTGSIVQHDLTKPYPKFFDQLLPVQALSISPTQPMICFSIGSSDQTHVSGIKVEGIQNISLPKDFNYLAQHYKFYGLPFQELCEHNSQISSNCQLYQISELWENIKIWFNQEEEEIEIEEEVTEEESTEVEELKNSTYFEKGKFKIINEFEKQEENTLKEILKETILKKVKEEIELNGNLQLGFMVLSILNLNQILRPLDYTMFCKDFFLRLTLNYLRLIKLMNDQQKGFKGIKDILRCEIRKKFSFKETEEIGLMILKHNLGCGSCGKRLNLGIGFEDQLIRGINPSINLLNNPIAKKKSINKKCGNCFKNYLLCSFCHLVVKDEPFRFCGKCGHGIHLKCLKDYIKEIKMENQLEGGNSLENHQVECLTGCGHLDCLKI
ncbi:WD40-repeat-containing domain protein [Melampsora americana]|nr:WD40-repeat-containing domain protein [Melampsora americana]